jgi:TonB-linked SusC/RagA family outer membrane protein
MHTLLRVSLLCCFLLLIGKAYGQITVKGSVKIARENSELPGVAIRVLGTMQGTLSDVNGNFSIDVTKPTDTLQFTFIGYTTQIVPLNNRNNLTIYLESETTELGEVVVTGFQEVDRKIFTGAAVSVKLSDIKSTGMTDATQMLEGRVAGVTVDNVSGTFGTSPKIRIRSNTSINGDSRPLMVVDGVILEDLNTMSADDIITGNANTLTASSIAGLNPDDIETYEILKDASATALYGTRAKNGVIVITTKRGKSGVTKVNYAGSFSMHLRPTYNQFDIMNSGDEMSVYREMYEKGLIDITTAVKAQNYGAMGKMFNEIADQRLTWGGVKGDLNESFLNKYENANTDWFGVLFKDLSLQQQHSISFTTGTEKYISYYSLNYLNDNGQTIADGVKRYVGTAKNTFHFTDKFTVDLKLNANYRSQQVPGTQDRDFDPITGRFKRDFDINPLSYALNTSRSIRVYDDNGDLEYFRRNYAPFNILEELRLNNIDITVSDISTQADLRYDLPKNITFKSVIQGRVASTKREHRIHEYSNQAEAYRAASTQYIQDLNPLLFRDPNDPSGNPKVVLPEGGFNNINQDELRYFYVRNSLNWTHTFKEVNNISILAGQEIKYTNRKSQRADGIGVVYESGGVVNTDPLMLDFLQRQGISIYAMNADYERFAGVFINGGYSYKEKYIFNGTVRYDGSNRLGKSITARYLPTWNVSGAWNIHQEDFFNLQSIDFLKLRATYGLSANLGPNTSALLNIKSKVTLRPNDVETYLYIEDLENANLTWEKLKEFNAGIDFGLLKSITGTFDFYKRNAYDLIGLLRTGGIGGKDYKWGNYADMKSHGFEFGVNTINLSSKDFTWNTQFNIGYSFDRISRLEFTPQIGEALVQGGVAVQGGPRRALFSTKFAGLDYRGIPTFYDDNGERVYYYDLQDRENLTRILKYEGPTEPRGAGGLGNIFTYKNFSLNVFLSFKFDYKIRLDDAFYPRYTDFNSLSKSFVNRWRIPGDEHITNVPSILDKQILEQGENAELLYAYDLYNKSTERVADGGYVRLKSIRLSYALPSHVAQRIRANTVQFSVEGQNLMLLYSDKMLNGQDPEFFSSGGVALPQPKLITTSISIGF